jgi:DNA-binding MarR family transcriptional regulator
MVSFSHAQNEPYSSVTLGGSRIEPPAGRELAHAGANEDRPQDQQEPQHEALLQRAARRMPVLLRVLKLVAKRVMSESTPAVAEMTMAKMGEGQLRALHVLYEEGPLQVGDLAARCGVADPTISKMLKGLEANGLVERQTDKENRRAVWVSVTPTGRDLFDQMQSAFEAGLAQVLHALTSEQLHDLIRTMDHLERLLAPSAKA